MAAAAVLAVVVSPASAAHAQSHAQHYVLDAFGGVHVGGGAPVISPATPYFGFDVAAAIEYVAVGTTTAVGDGYMVLDKFGGVHHGGALAADPPSSGTPYFGFDAARSLTLREAPPRIVSAASSTIVQFASTSAYTSVESVFIRAPMDGWLHITGTSRLSCNGTVTDDLGALLAVNVDTTAGTPPAQAFATWRDCSLVAGSSPTENRSVSVVVPVIAGGHTVHLLASKAAGSGTAVLANRSVTAEFIARDGLGQLSSPGAAATLTIDPSALGTAR